VAEAVRILAERLDVPYVIDESVSNDELAKPVRLQAVHLTGRQAFRWTVRSANLDAILVGGAMMIARPERLPRTWQLLGVAGADASQASPSGAEAVGSGIADLDWVDVPLSRVSRDVAERLGIDLVFHPRILNEQPVVALQAGGLDLPAVRRAVEEQLNADSEYRDGVIWIEPRDGASSGPAAFDTAAPRGGDNEMSRLDSALLRRLSIHFTGSGPRTLEQVLESACGRPTRIEAAGERQLPDLAARGTLFEVLEAARLLEGWDWRISPPEGSQAPGSGERPLPVLLIRTPDLSRSAP